MKLWTIIYTNAVAFADDRAVITQQKNELKRMVIIIEAAKIFGLIINTPKPAYMVMEKSLNS